MKGKIILAYQQNSEDPVLPNLDKERMYVRDVLRKIDTEDIADADLYGPYHEDLRTLMEDLNDKEYAKKIIAFSFSGHFSGNRLVFSDEDAKADGLAELMNQNNCPNLKLVFLNACNTSTAVRFFQEIGVPIIISTNVSVHDEKAEKFASSFFDRLSQGDTVDEAHNYAYGELKTIYSVDSKRVSYCYRNGLNQFYDPNDCQPWEFTYVEEGYKNWKITEWKATPRDYRILQRCTDPTKRKVLYIGNEKQKKLVSGVMTNIVSDFPVEYIKDKKANLYIKDEVRFADFIIVQLERKNKDLVTPEALKAIINDGVAPIILINEDYEGTEIKEFSNCLSDRSSIYVHTIPEYPGFNIKKMLSSKESSSSNYLEIEIKRVLESKTQENKTSLITAFKALDLDNQRPDMFDLPSSKTHEGATFNFFCIGGVVEDIQTSGHSLFLRVLMDGIKLSYDNCYLVPFASAVNRITNISTLNSFLCNLFGGSELVPADPYGIVIHELHKRLSSSSNSYCIVLDRPFRVLAPSELLKHLLDICKHLEAIKTLSSKLYFVIFDDTDYKEEELYKAIPKTGKDGIASLWFQPILKIDDKAVKTWWHKLDDRIKLRKTPKNILSELSTTSPTSYLGSVINELCIQMNCEHLIDEIYPQLNTGL